MRPSLYDSELVGERGEHRVFLRMTGPGLAPRQLGDCDTVQVRGKPVSARVVGYRASAWADRDYLWDLGLAPGATTHHTPGWFGWIYYAC